MGIDLHSNNTGKGKQENGTSSRFENVTCERDRRRKLKEKCLKLSVNVARPSAPKASSYELMPSGDNEIAANISNRKCKNEIVRKSYASVTTRSKEVH